MMTLAQKNDVKISKPELLAVLLYARGPKGQIGEEIVGTTRLTKLMFLIMMETDIKNYLNADMSFVAYKYGPFDSDIYDVLDALINLGIIDTNFDLNNFDENRIDKFEEYYDINTIFILSDIGIERTKKIVEEIPKEIFQKIESLKRIYSKKPLVKLLHYVYTKYPEYATESEAHIFD